MGVPQPCEPGHQLWRCDRLRGRRGVSGCGPGAAPGAAPATGWTPGSRVLAGTGREAAAPRCLCPGTALALATTVPEPPEGAEPAGKGLQQPERRGRRFRTNRSGAEGLHPGPAPQSCCQGLHQRDKPSPAPRHSWEQTGGLCPPCRPCGFPLHPLVPPRQRSAELPVVGGPAAPSPTPISRLRPHPGHGADNNRSGRVGFPEETGMLVHAPD